MANAADVDHHPSDSGVLERKRAGLAPATVTGDVDQPGPDLRLGGLVAGTWLAVLALTPVPSRQAMTAAIGLGCAALVLASAARRSAAGTRGSVLVLASALLGATSGAATTAAHTLTRDDPTVSRLVTTQASVRAELTLTSDPRLSRGSTPGRQTWVVPVTLRKITSGPTGIRLDAPGLVLGLGSGWSGLLPGQRVAVLGDLAVPRERDTTAAVLVVRDAPRLIGRPPWYQRLAGRLRAGLVQACRRLPAHTGGLLPGLVDADTSGLDPRVRGDFEAAGMSYLVVVAGLHLAIAVGCVMSLVRFVRIGARSQIVIGFAALGAFVVLARPGPSVERAAAMAVLCLLARWMGRPTAALPALLTGMFVLLVVEPGLALQVGFTLSALATLGLLILVPAWSDRLRRRGVRPGAATAITVPLAAQVACAPVIAAVWGVVGVSALPANVLAEPLLAPAMILGLAAMAVAPVSPGAAHGLAWLASWPCRWLIVVAHFAARVPAGVLPWPVGIRGGLLLTVVLIAALALWAHRPRHVVAPAAALLVVLAIGGVSAVPVTGDQVAREPAPPSRAASVCHARHGPLPDPACTPGALNPDVTQQTIGATICNPGWSATVRPPSTYTDELKRQQVAAYGYLDAALSDYEEDHLVPLSLGGAPADPRNLWPEPGASPNPKDRIEWDLQAAVCTHQVTLAEAQRAIATDWTSAEQRLGL
jgi:competence protein ComEC